MNIQQKTNKRGFTIIEVVLVLAIAALIFLMVFIALPALQRSQKDTQRKDDLARVQTAIQNYQSNNRNQLPTDQELAAAATAPTGFIDRYLTVNGNDTFADPDGDAYKFKTGTVPASFSSGNIYYTRKATCNGEQLKTNQGTNKIAFQYKLEGGGIACVSN